MWKYQNKYTVLKNTALYLIRSKNLNFTVEGGNYGVNAAKTGETQVAQ